MIDLRPPTEADWAAILAAADAAIPFDPAMNRVWLRNRQEFDAGRRPRRHYVAAVDGVVLGYGAVELEAPRARAARIFVVTDPDRLSSLGEVLLERLVVDARALSVETLWMREYVADEALLAFVQDRGFSETRRGPSSDGAFMYVLLERALEGSAPP